MFVVVTRDTQGVFGLWPDEMNAIKWAKVNLRHVRWYVTEVIEIDREHS